MIPFSQFCLAMKVAAAGPVSQEDAAAALQRYKKLEDSAPTMKQVGRYAGIGAVAAPVATVLKDTISGGKPMLGGPGNRLRTLAGNAVAGALTSGGIPLVRAHLDREAEKNTLRKYVAQGVAPKIAAKKEKTSAMSGVTPARSWAASEYADMGKMGERVYAGDLHQLKDQPEWKEFRGLRDKGQYSPVIGAGAGGLIGAGAGALVDRKYRTRGGAAALGGMLGSAVGLGAGTYAQSRQAATHGELASADEAALRSHMLGRLLKEHEGNFKEAAGAPTRGGFLMASEVAPRRQPKLHTAIQHEPQQIVEKMGAARAEWLQKRAAWGKLDQTEYDLAVEDFKQLKRTNPAKAKQEYVSVKRIGQDMGHPKFAGATTPAGRLASSHRVGLPKVSAPPGPSIADTVPTFGQRLPGANKTTIGKRSIRETPTLANTAPPQG